VTPPGPMVRTATSTGAAQAADWPERKTSPSPDPSRTGLKWTSTTTRRGSSPCLRCPWRVSSDWAIIVSLFSGSQGGPVCGSDREKWGGGIPSGRDPLVDPALQCRRPLPSPHSPRSGTQPLESRNKESHQPPFGGSGAGPIRRRRVPFRFAPLHPWLLAAARFAGCKAVVRIGRRGNAQAGNQMTGE